MKDGGKLTLETHKEDFGDENDLHLEYGGGYTSIRASPGGSVIRNLPANTGYAGDAVRSMGWEDLLEEEMATLPVFLPRKSHGQRSLAAYGPWRHKEQDTTEQLSPISQYTRTTIHKYLQLSQFSGWCA